MKKRNAIEIDLKAIKVALENQEYNWLNTHVQKLKAQHRRLKRTQKLRKQ